MSEQHEKSGVATLVDEAADEPGTQDRVAHRVLKSDWPIALCGANVREHLGTTAPAMGRCVDCLRIASSRGLRRPGWDSRG
jgi:hypothetical protein